MAFDGVGFLSLPIAKSFLVSFSSSDINVTGDLNTRAPVWQAKQSRLDPLRVDSETKICLMIFISTTAVSGICD